MRDSSVRHEYIHRLKHQTHYTKLVVMKRQAQKIEPTEIEILDQLGIDIRAIPCTNPDCKYEHPKHAHIQTRGKDLRPNNIRLTCSSCVKRRDTHAPSIDLYKPLNSNKTMNILKEIYIFYQAVEKYLFATSIEVSKQDFYLKYGEDPQDYLRSIENDKQSLHPSNYITKREEV